MRKFFLDLILVVTPIMITGLTWVLLSLSTLSADAVSMRRFYKEIIIRVDKRLDRIEDKIDHLVDR